jgi:hypothetical protein
VIERPVLLDDEDDPADPLTGERHGVGPVELRGELLVQRLHQEVRHPIERRPILVGERVRRCDARRRSR